MKKIVVVSSVVLFIFVGFAAMLIGCGSSGGGGTSVTRTYFGTSSFGHTFDISMTNNTFYAKDRESNVWVSGSYSTLQTKLFKATITDSNTAEAIGQVMYGIEVPGVCITVAPSGEGLVIVGAAKTATAPEPDDYNVVEMPYSGWTSANTGYVLTELGQTSPNNYYATLEIFTIADSPIASTNENYVFYPASQELRGATQKIVVSTSGFLVGFDSSNSGGFLGGKSETVDLSDLATHEYRVVVYSTNTGSDTEDIYPAMAYRHPTIADALQVRLYDNHETGTFRTENITVEFDSQDGNKIVHTSNYINGAGPWNGRAVVLKVPSTNKYIFSGLVDTGGNPLSVIAVQVDN